MHFPHRKGMLMYMRSKKSLNWTTDDNVLVILPEYLTRWDSKAYYGEYSTADESLLYLSMRYIMKTIRRTNDRNLFSTGRFLFLIT